MPQRRKRRLQPLPSVVRRVCKGWSLRLHIDGARNPVRKAVALTRRRKARTEVTGIFEDEDDDEYPGKPRLFWVRHEH